MARKADSHHVLPLFCDDLIASCVDMTPACFGAYMRLLCYAWTRGGIPDNEGACSRIAGGLEPGDWAAIRPRLVPIANGSQCDRNAIAVGSQTEVRLTHPRLELERQAVEAHKQKRSNAGKKGNQSRWGSQCDRNAIANGSQNASQTDRKSIAPNPSPSLKENTHTDASDEFRKPGWAADAWTSFVAQWNATERAAKWTPLMAPAGWVDLAASPGWLDRALQAMAKLPGCKFFETPLAVTKFFEFVDRILAGEFDNPQRKHGRPAAGSDDAERRAAINRKASEFAEYRPAPYRTPKEVAALAAAVKLTDDDL
jgi:uncharacterized protein YdaU (DUF1376 family)